MGITVKNREWPCAVFFLSTQHHLTDTLLILSLTTRLTCIYKMTSLRDKSSLDGVSTHSVRQTLSHKAIMRARYLWQTQWHIDPHVIQLIMFWGHSCMQCHPAVRACGMGWQVNGDECRCRNEIIAFPTPRCVMAKSQSLHSAHILSLYVVWCVGIAPFVPQLW